MVVYTANQMKIGKYFIINKLEKTPYLNITTTHTLDSDISSKLYHFYYADISRGIQREMESLLFYKIRNMIHINIGMILMNELDDYENR